MLSTLGKFLPLSIKQSLLRLYFRYKRGFLLVERSSTDYATHIPILIGLSYLLTVKNVLELGCGQFSTLLFLNSGVFPDVEKVRSFENDDEWIDKLLPSVAGDPRHEFIRITDKFDQALRTEALSGYDLIFVDDSITSVARAATIAEISAQTPQHPLVVIHDFEQSPYREATRSFKNRYHFNAFNPNTGIVWNQPKLLDGKKLREVQRRSRHYRSRFAPDNITAWIEVMKTLKGDAE